MDPGPAPRGAGWVEHVNAPMIDNDVARVRQSIRRDRPLGDPTWTLATARTLGLEYSLRPPGRPAPVSSGVTKTLANIVPAALLCGKVVQSKT